MNVSQFFYLIAFILFTSCIAENPTVEIPLEEPTQDVFLNVDQRLVPYFTEFEKEAANRGLQYNLDALEITGVIESISEDGVAGTCQYGNHIHHVTVDENFWNNASNRFREFVVFHELGHCVLFRDHTEEAFENGICISIMRSGLGDCRDAYIQQNRSYYLDELFSLSN